MNPYYRIYTLLVEAKDEDKDRYWPGWTGTKRTARLSSKDLEALLKKSAAREKLQAASKAAKKAQGTFNFLR